MRQAELTRRLRLARIWRMIREAEDFGDPVRKAEMEHEWNDLYEGKTQ